MAQFLHFRFDGEGLASAKLTRRMHGSVVWGWAGRPKLGGDGTVFDVYMFIEGIRRLPMWVVAAGVRSQYPGTEVLHTDKANGEWLAQVPMPEHRLWSSSLKFLAPLGGWCDEFMTRTENGMVDIYGRLREDANLQEILRESRRLADSHAEDIWFEPIQRVPVGPWPSPDAVKHYLDDWNESPA